MATTNNTYKFHFFFLGSNSFHTYFPHTCSSFLWIDLEPVVIRFFFWVRYTWVFSLTFICPVFLRCNSDTRCGMVLLEKGELFTRENNLEEGYIWIK